jgi:hypothetical protein
MGSGNPAFPSCAWPLSACIHLSVNQIKRRAPAAPLLARHSHSLEGGFRLLRARRHGCTRHVRLSLIPRRHETKQTTRQADHDEDLDDTKMAAAIVLASCAAGVASSSAAGTGSMATRRRPVGPHFGGYDGNGGQRPVVYPGPRPVPQVIVYPQPAPPAYIPPQVVNRPLYVPTPQVVEKTAVVQRPATVDRGGCARSGGQQQLQLPREGISAGRRRGVQGYPHQGKRDLHQPAAADHAGRAAADPLIARKPAR